MIKEKDNDTGKNKILILVEGKNKTEKTYYSNFDSGKKHIILHMLRGNIYNHIKLVNNNIKVITFFPCFELWLLLRYIYITSSMTNEKLINKLKIYYSKYEKELNIYLDIYKELIIAIERVKRLEEYQLYNNCKKGTIKPTLVQKYIK